MAEEANEQSARRASAEWLETEMENLLEQAVALGDEYWRQKEKRLKNGQRCLGVGVGSVPQSKARLNRSRMAPELQPGGPVAS